MAGSRACPPAWAVFALLASCTAQEECPADGGPGCGSPFTRVRKHLWPRARGPGPTYGVTNLTGPADLSEPWYQWYPGATRFRSVVLCGPLIDDESSLYVTSVHAIHKLSTDGQVRIWEYKTSGSMADCPSLWNGVLLGMDGRGFAFAVDIDTGKALWMRQHALGSGDTSYVENHDGVMIYEADPGNERVLAVDAVTGNKHWEFRPDTPVWNLMAQFPGDDTVLFQDQDSRTYRLGLHNGTLLWKAGGRHVPTPTWSDGGALLGPNGIIYAASSKGQVMTHYPTVGGGVHAYRVSDGALIWEKHLPRPFFTWPVIGRLAGRSDMSVIVGVGSNAYFPWKLVLQYTAPKHVKYGLLLAAAWSLLRCFKGGCKWLALRVIICLAVAVVYPIYVTYEYTQGRGLVRIATFEADVYAFNAETGDQQWVYHLPAWPYVSAAGDSEGYFERIFFCPQRPACLPAAYSAPTLDSEGIVWIGYHSGSLVGLRDADGDGIVTEQEVISYDTKAAFLHSGPAFAPGIFAITNCDSLHVWKN